MAAKPADRNVGKPSWRIRRRVIIGTLTFCALSVAYPILKDNVEMVEAVMLPIAGLATLVINGYIFGAVYEDKG